MIDIVIENDMRRVSDLSAHQIIGAMYKIANRVADQKRMHKPIDADWVANELMYVLEYIELAPIVELED